MGVGGVVRVIGVIVVVMRRTVIVIVVIMIVIVLVVLVTHGGVLPPKSARGDRRADDRLEMNAVGKAQASF